LRTFHEDFKETIAFVGIIRPVIILLLSRAEERDLPMTDEERQRAMDFIIAQQAKFSANIEKHDDRLGRLERIVKLMARAGLRARRQMREQDQRFDQRFAGVTEALKTLAEAQTRTETSIAHTDKRLDALIDIVREQRNGRSS